MEIFNVLNTAITMYGQTYDVYLNWIGKIIKFLIETVGSVGIGIVLFSLILKLLVLPFDIYQRIAMRKQNIKMKENQARMEKLQKQYANNKEMYNQKVMEMYKENGISVFSSCLPMILSMVIFFVAIDAFNVYAQYASVHNYNIMVDTYQDKIQTLCVSDDELSAQTVTLKDGLITVRADDKEVFYTLSAPTDGTDITANNYEFIRKASISAKQYYSNTDKDNLYYEELGQKAVLDAYDDTVLAENSFLWIKNIWKTDASYVNPVGDGTSFYNELKVTGCGSRSDGLQFNVNGKKVLLKDMKDIGNTNAYQNGANFDGVTKALGAQKEAPNGYFILIALSIGTILLQQFVSMRSQKEQQKYSTVDGQGASQQKMTMIIMTGMFAIFSFMYSAAFSIYMVTSNVFSLASTLIINKVVDVVEEKKERKALQEKHNQRFPNRVSPSDKENKKK